MVGCDGWGEQQGQCISFSFLCFYDKKVFCVLVVINVALGNKNNLQCLGAAQLFVCEICYNL